MNSLGEYVVKNKISTLKNEYKPKSKYDWDNYNYPPFVKLYHLDISELPEGYRLAIFSFDIFL
jgi:hypothetical protein